MEGEKGRRRVKRMNSERKEGAELWERRKWSKEGRPGRLLLLRELRGLRWRLRLPRTVTLEF